MHDSPDRPRDGEMPPGLARELERLWSPGALPGAVDTAIREAARSRLGEPVAARRRLVPLLPFGVGAAAAGLLLFLWLGGGRESQLVELDPRDVDGSGRVDIVDAYQLARAVARGAAGPARDLDGDGRVDQRDVDLVAAAAVRIDS